MNRLEIQKRSEPGFALELEAFKNLATNEHFTELITRLQIKCLLTYSVPVEPLSPRYWESMSYNCLLVPVSWNQSPGFNSLSLRIKIVVTLALEVF